jgi:hypothetical protein
MYSEEPSLRRLKRTVVETGQRRLAPLPHVLSLLLPSSMGGTRAKVDVDKLSGLWPGRDQVRWDVVVNLGGGGGGGGGGGAAPPHNLG